MPPFLILLTLVLCAVVVLSLLLVRLRQSLLVGYVLAGIALANSGILEWAGADSQGLIDALSEVGVVLLLFTLGIEFSVNELKSLKRPALLGGGIQVFATALIAVIIASSFGLPFKHAVVVAFIIAFSSTAVSLKSFQDMELPDSPQARVTLGIAIFQDLIVVLFMAILPALLSDGNDSLVAILLAMLKGGAFAAACLIASRHGIPQILEAVARSRSRELFTITVVALCAGVALLAGLLGLSPALGAFAAGIVVSESIYSHRILSDILPFKDLFLTVFFVSVGLLIDLKAFTEHWMLITFCTGAILFVKGSIVAFAARLSGLRMGSWIVTAAALSSTGEFSIVLLNRAAQLGAVSPVLEQVLLSCTAITMALVPTLMKLSLPVARHLRSKASTHAHSISDLGLAGKIEHIQDHVILCGYGPVGRMLHEKLHRANVRVIILEMNPDTVKELLNTGSKCLFADARHPEALELAHIERARAIAFTFPLSDVVLAALPSIRDMNPAIITLARAKFQDDAHILEKAGVNHVIHDEEESGQAMLQSVLHSFSSNNTGT